MGFQILRGVSVLGWSVCVPCLGSLLNRDVLGDCSFVPQGCGFPRHFFSGDGPFVSPMKGFRSFRWRFSSGMKYLKNVNPCQADYLTKIRLNQCFATRYTIQVQYSSTIEPGITQTGYG